MTRDVASRRPGIAGRSGLAGRTGWAKAPAEARSGRRAVAAGSVLALLLVTAWGSTAAAAQGGDGTGSAGAAALPTPLATSVQAGGGTWATVPMGNLSQPLNTFWQLLFRPDGASSWSDRVEATAVATNGGLVLAGSAGSLVVGVRPSNDLTFSPLIATSNAGRSWSNGLLDQGLASRPEALAQGPNGSALAIVQGHGGADVLRDAGNLSSWQPLTTDRALASAPSGRACEPNAITSVGYLSGAAVIGTSCERPGEAGIFVGRGGTWQPAGPKLAPGQGRAEVLGLVPANDGLAALLGLTSAGTSGVPSNGKAGRTSLIAVWADASGKWSATAPMKLGEGAHLVSFGATSAGGLFTVVAGANDGKELDVATGPGARWEELPAPPQGTATVAFLPGGTVDALAVKSTVLTVWALSPGSAAWAKDQVLDVPVQFGSSS
jgi:hypothetical protein